MDLTDERGVDVPIKTIDNKDGTFTVEYEPKTPGVYTAMIYFAEQEIPQSPIKVKVEPSIDTSGIKVEGLEPSKISLYCVFCSFLFLSIMYCSLFFPLLFLAFFLLIDIYRYAILITENIIKISRVMKMFRALYVSSSKNSL